MRVWTEYARMVPYTYMLSHTQHTGSTPRVRILANAMRNAHAAHTGTSQSGCEDARMLRIFENLRSCIGQHTPLPQLARDRQRGNERRKGESRVTHHSGTGETWGKRGWKPVSALQIHAQRHAPTVNSLPAPGIPMEQNLRKLTLFCNKHTTHTYRYCR